MPLATSSLPEPHNFIPPVKINLFLVVKNISTEIVPISSNIILFKLGFVYLIVKDF